MSIFRRCIDYVKEVFGFKKNNNNPEIKPENGDVNIEIKEFGDNSNEEKKVKLYRKRLNRKDSMIDINENNQQNTKNVFSSIIEIAKVSMEHY